MGITVTPKQREDVQRQLRRPELTRRVRERLEMVKAAALGDGAGRRRGAHRPLERALGRNGGARVGAFRRRRGGGALGCAALGPTRASRRVQADACKPTRASRRVQADEAYLAAMETALETPPAQLGLAFDVWTSERLSLYLRTADGGA
jgi:hypothetical protein